MVAWMHVLVQSSYEVLQASVDDLRARLAKMEGDLRDASLLEAAEGDGGDGGAAAGSG